jgi:hypothetical protein
MLTAAMLVSHRASSKRVREMRNFFMGASSTKKHPPARLLRPDGAQGDAFTSCRIPVDAAALWDFAAMITQLPAKCKLLLDNPSAGCYDACDF